MRCENLIKKQHRDRATHRAPLTSAPLSRYIIGPTPRVPLYQTHCIAFIQVAHTQPPCFYQNELSSMMSHTLTKRARASCGHVVFFGARPGLNDVWDPRGALVLKGSEGLLIFISLSLAMSRELSGSCSHRLRCFWMAISVFSMNRWGQLDIWNDKNSWCLSRWFSEYKVSFITFNFNVNDSFACRSAFVDGRST